MATYIIGDVQGCLQELEALLDKIAYRPKHDALWFAGDLVNRGPHSLETLRLIKKLPNTMVVLGNHDLHCLSVAAGVSELGKKDTFGSLLNAPDMAEICEWLSNRQLVHFDAHRNAVLVHAGIHPLWDVATTQALAKEVETILRSTLKKQLFKYMYGNTPKQWKDSLSGWKRLRFIINVLTRMRFCTAKGALDLEAKFGLSQTADELIPWFKHPLRKHREQTRIYFGHWAALEGKSYSEEAISLDTGCVWGGFLTALRLEDSERFCVPSIKQLKNSA